MATINQNKATFQRPNGNMKVGGTVRKPYLPSEDLSLINETIIILRSAKEARNGTLYLARLREAHENIRGIILAEIGK